MPATWKWFGGGVLLALLLAATVCFFLQVPSPGLFAHSNNVDIEMENYGGQFGSWTLRQILVVGVLLILLTIWAFYLQIWHFGLRENGSLGRWLLCLALGIGGGLLVLHRAIGWALEQRDTTVLRQALNDRDAARYVSFISGDLLPLSWRWALHADLLVVCLVGVAAGHLFYHILRSVYKL